MLVADDIGVELSQTVTIYYYIITFYSLFDIETYIVAKAMEYFLHFIKNNKYIYFFIKYISRDTVKSILFLVSFVRNLQFMAHVFWR